MKVVTLQGKSINDIEEKIAKAISESYQPTLAIIFAHYYLSSGITQILDGVLLRMGADKLKSEMGFEFLKLDKKELPTLNAGRFHDEPLKIMYLKEFFYQFSTEEPSNAKPNQNRNQRLPDG